MSRPTALQTMRVALQQYHVTESPAGSNKVKYNTAFYGKAVRGSAYPWCATFSWWCGWMAAGKNQNDNPIFKSASAADIQDRTVKSKGGKYILAHTSNNSKKKAALPNVRFGDEISFNFKGGTSRAHTALVVGRFGNYIWCIEGNTSFTDKGSQSNGGCVALRQRFYTNGVCIVRPDYAAGGFPAPITPYTGRPVKMHSRGWFKYGDKGEAVKALQEALSWANGYRLSIDGDAGSCTFAEIVIFQVANGLEPDGEFGEKSQKKLNELIEAHR